MASQTTNVQWRELEDGETVQTNRMKRLRQFAKVTSVLAVLFTVASLAAFYSRSSSQQPFKSDGELSVEIPSPVMSLNMKVEKEVTAAQISEVKTVTAFNDLLSLSIVLDAKELYSAMSNEQLKQLNNHFLETIGTSAPQVLGTVADKKHAYSSQSEHAERLEVFKDNILSILTANAIERKHSNDASRARYGITVHADWTEHEFKKTRLTSFNQSAIENMKKGLKQMPVPTELRPECDLVYTGPVRSQGVCGSCWAYSAVQQLRYMTYAATEQDPGTMSAQYLIDCEPDVQGKSCGDGSNGCCGGLPFRADQWLEQSGGLPTKESYGPSLSETDPSAHECNPDITKAVRPVGGPNHYSTEDAIANALCEKGPVSIAIAANSNLQHYTSGVMNVAGCPAEQINHAVLYVGFVADFNGRSVHVMLNSWGEHWGVSGVSPFEHGDKNGYALLAYGENVCNIEALATGPDSVEVLSG